MANTFFRFKQFIVHQDKSAMKVCTDACIYGAFISEIEKDNTNDETNILDIGTGTGLLSLMIAQKAKGNIDAVEIDEKACQQAKENLSSSKWSSRLSIFLADIKKFSFGKKYDIIVSNPPFFENSLKSPDNLKNIAKHAASLSYSELVKIVSANLLLEGRFYVLLPVKEYEVFEKIAIENKTFLLQKVFIKQNNESDYFRTIGVFSNITHHAVTEESITIKDANDKYSDSFIKLLKDYYLYL